VSFWTVQEKFKKSRIKRKIKIKKRMKSRIKIKSKTAMRIESYS